MGELENVAFFFIEKFQTTPYLHPWDSYFSLPCPVPSSFHGSVSWVRSYWYLLMFVSVWLECKLWGRDRSVMLSSHWIKHFWYFILKELSPLWNVNPIPLKWSSFPLECRSHADELSSYSPCVTWGHHILGELWKIWPKHKFQCLGTLKTLKWFPFLSSLSQTQFESDFWNILTEV